MDFLLDMDHAAVAAAKAAALEAEVERGGDFEVFPECADSDVTSAQERESQKKNKKRKAAPEAEPEAAGGPAEKRARTQIIQTVTIKGGPKHTADGVVVELSPKHGRPFTVLVSSLPIEYSFWNWCEMDIDAETHQVLDLRKKPAFQAADAKKALKDFGITVIPKGLDKIKGKVVADKFKFQVSRQDTSVCLSPVHAGDAWLKICLVFGENVAAQMSDFAAHMIWEKFTGGDDMALVLASWGDVLFPTAPHRFDFVTPRPGNPIEEFCSEEAQSCFKSIRALKTILLRDGVGAQLDSASDPNWEKLGLVKDGLVQLFRPFSFCEQEEFENLCLKMNLVTTDYQKIKVGVKTHVNAHGKAVREIHGAHLWEDSHLIEILRDPQIDSFELYGLKELCVTSVMLTEKGSTLFRAFASHFAGIEQVRPQSELFQWVHDRLLVGYNSALSKSRKFEDGGIYQNFEPASWAEVLKITGYHRKPAFHASQIVLFDHPDDLARFFDLVPQAFCPGVHFNHHVWRGQMLPSPYATSTEVCLMTQALRDRVDTVFVVVREDTSSTKLAETSFLAKQKFVRIIAPPEHNLPN